MKLKIPQEVEDTERTKKVKPPMTLKEAIDKINQERGKIEASPQIYPIFESNNPTKPIGVRGVFSMSASNSRASVPSSIPIIGGPWGVSFFFLLDFQYHLGS